MSEVPANMQLAGLMAEANMSRKGLARRVADISRQRGDDPPANPDHNRVRRWVVGGEIPKLSTQRCIVLALRDKLGRHLSLEDAGFPPDDEGIDLVSDGVRYPEQAGTSVTVLATLADADQHDQRIGQDWVSESTAGVITNYLLGQSLVVATDFQLANGRSLAAPIRDATASFMQLDFQYGGGYLRSMLLHFFQTNVVPLLKQRHPDVERRELFSAAAEVAQLLGWTSYDAGRHWAAQRYLIQGLRLAREAGDHMLGGRLLSNLSHQANYLGRYGEALHYARAAQQATLGVATPAVATLFLAHEARALASLGDSQACAAVIDRAETTLDRSQSGSEPAWASYVDQSEIASEWAHCFRDLGEPRNAESFVEQAIQGVPPRTQAFMRMVNAKAILQEGNLDEAIAMANQAVDLAGPLDSARYQSYLTDFHAGLVAKHPRDQRVLDFRKILRSQYPSLDLRRSA